MRRTMQLLIVLGLALATSACTGVSLGVGVRGGYYPGHYYGRGPFWGYGGDHIVVVPPGGGGGIDGPDIGGPPVAVPLPEPPSLVCAHMDRPISSGSTAMEFSMKPPTIGISKGSR